MDLAAWEALFVQVAPSDTSDVRVWFDGHARKSDGRLVGIVRPGIGIAASPQVTLWAGYAWIPTAETGLPLASEHRVWQQLSWTVAAGRVVVGVRPRFEQRFAAGTGPGLRGRVFNRAQVDVVGPLSVVVWDEPFVAFNDSGFSPAGFDQNRLFVGPALRYDAVRIEMGYLDQRVHREGDWTTTAVVATAVYAVF